MNHKQRANLYCPGGDAYVWLQFDAGLDLQAAKVAVEVGEQPEWVTDHEYSWDDLACIPSFGDDVLKWMLWKGIAPYQPFLVQMSTPVGTVSHTQDGTEYDVDFEGGVVYIAPLDPLEAARRWGEYVTDVQQSRRARERQRQQELDEAWRDVDAMYLRRDSCSRHYWDGWPSGPDTGRWYTLYTTRPGFNRQLAQGRHDLDWRDRSDDSKSASWDVAMEILLRQVGLRAPHIPPERIRSLPVRHF